MPVFTFEKISPPKRRVTAAASVADKPRGVLPRLLDRFTEARARRINPDGEAAQKQPRKSSK